MANAAGARQPRICKFCLTMMSQLVLRNLECFLDGLLRSNDLITFGNRPNDRQAANNAPVFHKFPKVDAREPKRC